MSTEVVKLAAHLRVSWSTISLICQYLFFTRFPVIGLLTLIVMPVLFDGTIHDSFLVLDVVATASVIALSVLTAWMCALYILIILEYAQHRFLVPAPRWLDRFVEARYSRLVVSSLCALPMAIELYLHANAKGRCLRAIIAGVALAVALLWVHERLRRFFVDRIRVRLQFLIHSETALFGKLGSGYLDESGTVRKGHLAATAVVVMLLAGYVFGYFAFAPTTSTINIPPMAYLLLLLQLGVSIISGLAFWLDGYRVPVVFVLLAIAILLLPRIGYGDHFFSVIGASPHVSTALKNAVPAAAPAVAEAVRAESDLAPVRTARSRDPFASLADDSDSLRSSEMAGITFRWTASQQLVLDKLHAPDVPTRQPAPAAAVKPVVTVVCASGGGLRSAAWTAQVLAGLQRSIGPQFTKSIRLVSAVSGGCLGSTYFLEKYDKTLKAPPARELENVLRASQAPSLFAVGWGLVYPDVLRVIRVSGRLEDRGWALEQAWRRALPGAGEITTKLSDWRRQFDELWFPAVVFSATIVESGEPLLITTADSDWKRTKTFSQLYPDEDLEVMTAVRLASTFPFVSPVTRAVCDKGDGVHIADGGYYDNFGVQPATSWIEDYLRRTEGTEELKNIVVIQIQESPPPDDRAQLTGETNFWRNAFGPVYTLVNSRSASQSAANRRALERLDAVVAEHGGLVKRFLFYPSTSGSLSWQLPNSEVKQLEREWSRLSKGEDVAQLKELFKDQGN